MTFAFVRDVNSAGMSSTADQVATDLATEYSTGICL
jgi:hypothetical protein